MIANPPLINEGGFFLQLFIICPPYSMVLLGKYLWDNIKGSDCSGLIPYIPPTAAFVGFY